MHTMRKIDHDLERKIHRERSARRSAVYEFFKFAAKSNKPHSNTAMLFDSIVAEQAFGERVSYLPFIP